MKNNPMIILVVEPGKKPVLDVIDDSLESMQKVVGGYIETIYPFEDEVVLVCNEEGKINGSPLNRAIYNTNVFSCFNGEILDIIAGTFFLCYAPANSDSFLSLPEKLIYKYADLFDTPEKFYRDESGKIQVEKVECDNDFLGINWQFYEHRCFVEIEFTDNKDYKTIDFRSVEKDSDTYRDIDNFAKICAGKNAIGAANNLVKKLNEGKSIDNVLNNAHNRFSIQEIQSYKEKYPYIAQCADFDKVINAGLSKNTLELIEQSIAAYELNDDMYYDENLGELIIPDDIVVNMDALSWYAGGIDTKQFLEHVKEYDLDQDVTKDDFGLDM